MFLAACMPTRMALAGYAFRQRLRDPPDLPLLGLGLMIGASFAVLWACPGIRPVGPESSAPGNLIWWAPYRVLHAALYLTFAVMYANRRCRVYAWVPLCADVLLGLLLYTTHRSPLHNVQTFAQTHRASSEISI
jgi:hypothetical protein